MLSLKSLLDDPLFMHKVPFTREFYKKGDVIFEEDDEGTDFYLVVKGVVAVGTHIASTVGDHATGLTRLGEDDVFGELSMFDGEPRSARVTAETDCELIHFDGHSMILFMDANPDKGYFILREIFMRLIMHMRDSTIRNKTILQLYLAEQSD